MRIPHTKFWLALVTLGMAFAAMLLGHLGGAEFVTIASLVVGMYSAANIGATFAHKSGD